MQSENVTKLNLKQKGKISAVYHMFLLIISPFLWKCVFPSSIALMLLQEVSVLTNSLRLGQLFPVEPYDLILSSCPISTHILYVEKREQ